MSRYCIVVDLDKCIDCKACEVGCKYENDLPLGERWNRVLTCGPYGTFPDLSLYYLPVMCQQCENAPCVKVCPTGASYRDPDTNVVLVDKEKCIGCKYCMMACPYSVRSWNQTEKVVEKCTLCAQRTSAGEVPFCVYTCCGDARYYGDLDDPNSDASKAIAAKPDAVHSLKDFGNKPATVYLLSDKYGQWHEDAQGWHDTNAFSALGE
ncbi:MAG: 4Fe-4S dicluster domain-containing protein [Eggerthellaceae bacterium]|nr:4Fe-4S dicluster domain-containing protein [Eggerthellaceae bacterium]